MNQYIWMLILGLLFLMSGCFNSYESEYISCQNNYTNLEKDYNSCQSGYEEYVKVTSKEIKELKIQINNFENNETFLAENVNSTVLSKVFFEQDISGINITINNITFIVLNLIFYFTLGLKFDIVSKFILNIKISKNNFFAGLIISLIMIYVVLEYIYLLINFISPFI